MASDYSDNLRIELISTGEQAGAWGTTTNRNLGTLIEQAISGSVSVTTSATNEALTALNGVEDQARNMMLVLNTSSGGDFNVYVPPAPKIYIISNVSGYVVTLYNSTIIGNTTAAGNGVSVPAGVNLLVYTDGVNFRTISAANLTGTLTVANGGTGATTLAANNVILGNGTSAVQTVAPGTDGNFLVSDGTTWTTESGATARTSLGVAIGSDVQGYDAGLADIAGLAVTNGNFIVGDGANWVAESGATARTSLGLGTLATQSPTGTADSTTFLRGDNTWSAPPAVSTSSVLNATKDASLDAVGSYAFLAVISISTPVSPGSTSAGSNLHYVGVDQQDRPGTSPTSSGTWRCMGYGKNASGSEINYEFGTLWLRIS